VPAEGNKTVFVCVREKDTVQLAEIVSVCILVMFCIKWTYSDHLIYWNLFDWQKMANQFNFKQCWQERGIWTQIDFQSHLIAVIVNIFSSLLWICDKVNMTSWTRKNVGWDLILSIGNWLARWIIVICWFLSHVSNWMLEARDHCDNIIKKEMSFWGEGEVSVFDSRVCLPIEGAFTLAV